MNDRQMANWHSATCPEGHPYIDVGPHVAICAEDRHADGIMTHGPRSAIAELVAALRAAEARVAKLEEALKEAKYLYLPGTDTWRCVGCWTPKGHHHSPQCPIERALEPSP